MKKGITLLGVLVVVLAVTSGAFAAANHYLITSSSQIKNGVVSTADLSPAAHKALQGQKGDTGAAGPQGSKGDTGAVGAVGAQGPQGRAGVSGYEVRTWRYSKDDANSDMGPGYSGVGGGAIATVACSPGKVAIAGGYRFTSDHGERLQLVRRSRTEAASSRPSPVAWTGTRIRSSRTTTLAGSCRSTTR